MSYEIKTDVYQGPFDLLLDLIMKQDVEIFDVELSKVIEAFIHESETLSQDAFDLEVSTEFLLIASTLVELKIKRLLPRQENVELDEELLKFEHRDLLLARLLECKTFKDVAQVFTQMMDAAAKRKYYSMPLEEPFASMAPDPLERTPIEKLKEAYMRAFTGKKVENVSVIHLHDSVISVKEAVDEVIGRLSFGKNISFRALSADADSKLHVVVRFLAVLELYKQGFVEIEMSDKLGDMNISLIAEADQDVDVNVDDWGEDIAAIEKKMDEDSSLLGAMSPQALEMTAELKEEKV